MTSHGSKRQNDLLESALSMHLQQYLHGHGDIAAVYMLGSAANGTLRSDSDIDIALLPVNDNGIPLRFRLELAAKLELEFNRTMDIGVISPHNLIYANEAILHGRRILTLDKYYTEAAETRFLGCYLTFRQDRKPVEDSYIGP